MLLRIFRYSFLQLLLISFFQSSFAFEKPEYLKEVKLFTSLDSIFITQQDKGNTRTESNNFNNIFSNINGISLGASYTIPDSNLSISFKTNRLMNFPITKQIGVYNGNDFIKNSSLSFQSQNDILSFGYRMPDIPNVILFTFISNSKVTTTITDNTSVNQKVINTFYYGIGTNVFLTQKLATSFALILPNNEVGTDYSLAISLNYILL